MLQLQMFSKCLHTLCHYYRVSGMARLANQRAPLFFCDALLHATANGNGNMKYEIGCRNTRNSIYSDYPLSFIYPLSPSPTQAVTVEKRRQSCKTLSWQLSVSVSVSLCVSVAIFLFHTLLFTFANCLQRIFVCSRLCDQQTKERGQTEKKSRQTDRKTLLKKVLQFEFVFFLLFF